MADFERAFTRTVGLEGGYSNDVGDPGGPTRYGITQADARSAGYGGDMKDFPLTLAKQIYRSRYWNLVSGDALGSQDLAEVLFDAAVNVGAATAIRFFQRALNVLNDAGKLWLDIPADGVMGPTTLGVYATAANLGMADDVLETTEILHGAYYVSITETRPQFEAFFKGWLRNRVALRIKTGTA